MNSTANNPYKEAAQLAKVLKLVQVLRDIEATADQVASMTDEQWTLAEKAAEVRHASNETRERVVAMMSRPRCSNPFRGL
jgi:uncharacterized protein with PhoU and TrkA domain